MSARGGMTNIPECISPNGLYYNPSCVYAPQTGTTTKPSFAQVEAEVYQVLVRLRVPPPVIRLGPEPSANEWNMAVVGLPVWAWTTEASTRRATLTEFGHTFTLNARRTATVFDFGDGTAAVTCSSMSAYPGIRAAGSPSPNCGHTYLRASLPDRIVTLTARARWSVRWSALGYSGTIPLELSSQRQVRVGELQSIRVG